ncbi:hypothetical protein K1719_012219 [Acacia pycnantha]|nr:hypothetical protein K1719_012219 [Acacia pycnantha]
MTHQQELADMMIIVYLNLHKMLKDLRIIIKHDIYTYLHKVLLQNVTSSLFSQLGGLQSDPSTLAYKETVKEVGKAIPTSSFPATTSADFEAIVGQQRTKQNLSCIESIPKDTTPAQVASMKEKHEQGSQGDDATRKAAIAIQSIDSKSMKQTRVSSTITQSLEETEKEAVRRHASQLPIALTSTNSKSVTSSVVSQVEGLKFGPSTLTIKETRDHSSIQEEAESEKPIKATLPQVIPSLHYCLSSERPNNLEDRKPPMLIFQSDCEHERGSNNCVHVSETSSQKRK